VVLVNPTFEVKKVEEGDSTTNSIVSPTVADKVRDTVRPSKDRIINVFS